MAKGLRVEIVGDTRSYARALKDAGQATSTFGSSVAKAAKFAAIGLGAAGVGGAVLTLKRGFDELFESQKVIAQTGAALQSTGSAANVTAKQVADLATSMSELTAIDDEAIQAGENMLLTFTNIRNETGKGNDIFNQATQAVGDFATRMNKGAVPSADQMAKSSILLGKALNDPVTGYTKLKRAGVEFSDAQVKQIQTLTASGHTMEAQKVILRELTKEFGGSAKAAGETLPGQLTKLKNSFDELAGQAARVLAPAIGGIADNLTGFFDKIAAAPDATSKLKLIVQGVGNLGTDVFNALKKSVASVDWNLVWGQIKINSALLVDRFNTALQNADWSAVGKGIGEAIKKTIAFSDELGAAFTKELATAARKINWGEFAKAMASGLLGSGLPTQIKNALLLNFKLTNPVGLAVDSGLAKKAIGGISDAFNNDPNWSNVNARVQAKLLTALKTAAESASAGARLSASASATQVGAAMASGIAQGLLAQVTAVALAAARVVGAAFAAAGQKKKGSGPWQFTRHEVGLPLAIGVVEGFADAMKTLGPGLGNALVASFKKLGPVAKKGTSSVTDMIVAAAKKAGVDARAALAVAMTEGGLGKPQVGDSGTSFGPFQLHIGGASPFSDPQKAAQFANSIQGITYALNQMAKAGAAGKTGFDAIRAIVTSFERPANPAAEIAKAIGYYKQIPEQVGNAVEAGGKKTADALAKVFQGLAGLVKQYGPQIGVDHARGIIAGLIGKSGDIVAAAKAQMEKVVAAMALVAQTRTDLKEAFATLATDAFSAFDRIADKWKSKSQKILDQMTLEDQINSAVKAVADAQTEIDNAVAARQTITRAEGESDADFNARLAEADARIQTAVEAAGAAERSYREFQLGLNAVQEQAAHDRQLEADKTAFAKRLTAIQGYLAEHPKAYAKTQNDIIALMKKYHLPLKNAGLALSDSFAKGMNQGIGEVIKAAKRLAAALEEIPGVTGGGGGGGGTGNPAGPQRPPDVGRGNNFNVTINGDVTGDEVVEKVRAGLRNMNINNGVNPLAT